MARGRHSSDGSGAFYRDLAMMILGIVLVGAAVFLGLLLLVGDDPTATTTSTVTTAVDAPTTTAGPRSTTSTSVASSSTTTAAATTSTAVVEARPPEDVRVVVLNSIGEAGIAGRFTQQLTEAGYQTLQADDYEPEQDPSRIWYRSGFSAEANELLGFLPDALVEPLPDEDLQPGADVIAVLGTGYEE